MSTTEALEAEIARLTQERDRALELYRRLGEDLDGLALEVAQREIACNYNARMVGLHERTIARLKGAVEALWSENCRLEELLTLLSSVARHGLTDDDAQDCLGRIQSCIVAHQVIAL